MKNDMEKLMEQNKEIDMVQFDNIFSKNAENILKHKFKQKIIDTYITVKIAEPI